METIRNEIDINPEFSDQYFIHNIPQYDQYLECIVETDSFVCIVIGCNQRFALESQLLNHIKSSHNSSDVSEETEKACNASIRRDNRKFRSRQLLWRHKRHQCQYTMEDIGNQSVNQEVSDNHYVGDDQQMDQSLQCMSETTSSYDTNIAEKSHSNPEFVCFSNGCNQKFPLASLLLKHIKSSHSGTNVSEEIANNVYATRPYQMSDEQITLSDCQDYGNAYLDTEPVTSHESGCLLCYNDDIKNHSNKHIEMANNWTTG